MKSEREVSEVRPHIRKTGVGVFFARAARAFAVAVLFAFSLSAQQPATAPRSQGSPNRGSAATTNGTAAQAKAQPKFFRITPLRPVAELREEALRATPPVEHGQFLPAALVEVTSLDPTVKLDIRYATPNNFLGTPVYEQARAFLQRPAAEALVRANRKLREHGVGLLIHDAYRPWYVTKIFWEATPPEKREFVANPAEGSRHNRGCAVDITLYDLQTGRTLEMPSLYDEMSPRSYANYAGGTSEQNRNRKMLKDALEAEGFEQLRNEWWHFDYKDWKRYPIGNQRFDRIPTPTPTRGSQKSGVKAPEHSGDPTGTVVVQAEIDEHGIVKSTRVVRSLTPDTDRRAVEAVKQSTFNPAMKDGHAVAVSVRVNVKFGGGFSHN